MSRSDSSTRYEALIQLLRSADRLWEAGRVFFARWDLSPSQFNILNLLGDQPAGCSQTELSRALLMHRSNVTGLIDRLEKRGLVERHADPGDRRAHQVRLTRAGRALWREILPEYRVRAERVWGALTDRRVAQLARDLEALGERAEYEARNP